MGTQFKGTARCVVAVAAILIALATATAPAGAEPGKTEMPSRFKIAGDSNLATADGELWFETTVYSWKARSWQAEVVRHRPGGGWDRLPLTKVFQASTTDFAVRASDDGGPSLPCVGGFGLTAGKPGGRVQCFEDGHWNKLALDPSFDGMRMAGLDASGPDFTALFTNWTNGSLPRHQRRPRIALGKIEDGKVTPLGPVLNVKGPPMFPTLGRRTDDAAPVTADVMIQGRYGKAVDDASLATLEEGRWTMTDLPRRRGSARGGPVRSADGVYTSVSGLRSESATVLRTDDGQTTKLSGRNRGSAGRFLEGTELFPVGDDVWLWSGAVDTDGERHWAGYEYWTPIEPDGSGFARPRQIPRDHRDLSSYPGMTEYQGHPVFLYSRAQAQYSLPVIDFSRVRAGNSASGSAGE